MSENSNGILNPPEGVTKSRYCVGMLKNAFNDAILYSGDQMHAIKIFSHIQKHYIQVLTGEDLMYGN